MRCAVHDDRDTSSKCSCSEIVAFLRREIANLDSPDYAYGCICPSGAPSRKITDHDQDDVFYPRIGCLECNRWHAPVRLRKS